MVVFVRCVVVLICDDLVMGDRCEVCVNSFYVGKLGVYQ